MSGGKVIEKVSIEHARSYLEESRRRGGRMDDFQKVFRAEEIDPKRHVPVEGQSRHTAGGRPLLWFTPDFRSAVVDAKVFSDLQCADATRLAAGQSVAIGTVRAPSLAALSGRQLLWFLVEFDVILSYAHVSAEVSLVGERDGADSYQAELEGTHVYYTDRRNEDSYSLAVSIDKKTGLITVSAR